MTAQLPLLMEVDVNDSDQGIAFSVFIPGLLLAATLIVHSMTARDEFNSQLSVLATQSQQQDPTIAQAQKLRGQLQSIAGATASLAEQGNQNAILIRKQLEAQGVSINAPATTP